MSEQIRTVRAIGILEGLLERFVDAASGRGPHAIPTSSENERDAIQMQQQGRREAWEDAARAIREALGEHRIALEAGEVPPLDLRAEWETLSALVRQQGREIVALREVEKRLDVEKRAHSLTMNQLAAVRQDLERVAVERDAARQDARDLREERDGRGERIKQLVGDLERVTAEKGEAVRLLEIANRERDKARDRAAGLRVEFDKASAERDEARRLALGAVALVDLGRHIRTRAAASPLPSWQAKLKCAAILVLEVAAGPDGLVPVQPGEDLTHLYAVDRNQGRPKFTRIEPVTLSAAAQREIARARAELGDIDLSRVRPDGTEMRAVLVRLLDALPKTGTWVRWPDGSPVWDDAVLKQCEIADQIIAVRDRVSAGEVHAKSGIIRHLEDAWMLLKFSTEIPALPPRKS